MNRNCVAVVDDDIRIGRKSAGGALGKHDNRSPKQALEDAQCWRRPPPNDTPNVCETGFLFPLLGLSISL